MGNEQALASDGDEIELDVTQTDEDLLEAGDDQPEKGEETPETDDQEIEIVLPEDDGSHPKPKQLGFTRRINKLNLRNQATTDRATTAEAENQTLKAQNELYQLALAQKKEPETAAPPDPTDFDDGASDPKYVKALNAHNQAYFDAQFERRNGVQQEAPKPVNANLERRQTAHYTAADKLGVKDYDATESIAVGILGNDAVNQLIAETDSSPLVLYYLGKNKDVAEDIAELIKTNPVAGVLKLGALGAQLKVQPKRKSGVIPNPDNELDGTTRKARKHRGPPGATFS